MRNKKRTFMEVAEEVAKGDKKKVRNPKPKAKRPKASPKAEEAEKHGGGRPSTVDYARERRLHIPMSEDAFQLLEKAVAIEAGRRYPERVDKGLIVEYALREYCAKHKIT
jgi:hypothetical protein